MRQTQVGIAKPSVLYTEFINVEGYLRNPSFFEKKLKFLSNERPIVAQVFGSKPESFFEVVGRIATLGFDDIDINMGCPARKVLETGGGGALIGNLPLCEKIIKGCLGAIKNSENNIPLSVKTRIGVKEVVTKEWISFLCSFPLAEITVHGRLLRQGVSGPVFWDEIRFASSLARNRGITFLGNGGVENLIDAKKKCDFYGLDGVLIGQAALGNPWVFLENYRPSKEEIFKTIISHGQLAWDFYGPKGFVTMRKHLGWYPRGLPGFRNLKTKLQKVENFDQLKTILLEFGTESRV